MEYAEIYYSSSIVPKIRLIPLQEEPYASC